MAFTPISTALVAPNTAEPDTFNDDADKWAADIIPWTAEVNAAGAYINDVGDAVDADAAAASASATAAANSATAALASQNLAAASADYKGLWSAQTGAANKPYSVFHNGSFWALNVNLANVTTQEPSPSNASWQFISGTTWQPLKTASFSAVMNAAYDVLATGSAVSVALQAGADGNFVIIRNSFDSTQTVTITNAIWTIKCVGGITINTGDTITLRAGDMLRFKARSGTILEQY